MRLFVGIRIPQEVLPQIRAACQPLSDALGVRMVGEKNLHLTLKFIGEVDEEGERMVQDALSRVEFAPFEVLLCGAGAFPSRHFPRAIWIGGRSEGCQRLAAKVEEALCFLGLKKEKFAIHLTVARSPKGTADIEEFLEKNAGRQICSFVASSFCLFRSTLLPQGPVYEVLREYKAQG
ncbi:MAG: RNA 2',3'-cyclic phosphodiesterase [Candidatus Micrarchaeota archaeon]|nr:RNA 2',3'-cyclic phosphodiesterase [Candidatus Micrarchaeota archaeon]